MNSIQIEQFNKKLSELGKFTNGTDKIYKESEIIDWISECVNVFYEIGVDAVIIRHFLEYFSFGIVEVDVTDDFMVAFHGKQKDFEKVKNIGPFHENLTAPLGYTSHRRAGSGDYSLVGSFYYAKVAFSSAKNILKNKATEKKIVPIWLTEQISEYKKIKHLASSLELIENKYESKDAHGLVTESITLLDSILNLDSELKIKDKIGAKLNSLIENEDKCELFGVNKDIARGLNSGRILRNNKIIHKDSPIKYEIPFLVATSFAYLVLFFMECSILNGKIINYEN